jgi:hypothetical protein
MYHPKGGICMKAFARLFAGLYEKDAKSETQKIYREWDRLRSKAISPNDLAEIDAIFARHLGA